MYINLAPIVLFVYNRPKHTKLLLDSLQKNKIAMHSILFIYCDGPKLNSNNAELDKIKQVREIIKNINFCKEVFIIELDSNAGLANSVINAVNNLINKYNKIIVLEDDLILSDSFLDYMNMSLTKYENHSDVYQISAHTFFTSNNNSAIFLPFTTSWGWGTWKRAWEKFDTHSIGWEKLLSDSKLRDKFNLNGVYKYDKMLFNQMNGLINSWAIRWYWSVFINNGLVLFPPYSLVENVGFDGSGTHGIGIFRNFRKSNVFKKSNVITYPSEVLINENEYKLVKKAIYKVNGGFIGKIIDFFKNIF
jgi:hypothetical protein